MKRLALMLVATVALATLTLAGWGQAAGPLTVDWSVLAGGGGHEVQGTLVMDSIIGTWYGADAGTVVLRLYLPVIRR
jgi:hypothetical protein